MSPDVSFITNEGDLTLSKRFAELIKDTKFFDCIVGYFYSTGFYKIYKSLETTEKIRILVGIKTDRPTFEALREAEDIDLNKKLRPSTKEIKEDFAKVTEFEIENSPDSQETETGIRAFTDWIKDKKLEIRAYPSGRLHSKLYVMTFAEGDRDKGRVITGSSNFTEGGFDDNLELNVELKTRADYDHALAHFERLWKDSIDVSEKYVETINTRTWLNDTLKPYDLYLKFLYEYFKEKIAIDAEELDHNDLPENYLELEYQTEAVKDAKAKLLGYGGVFLSDVVGLGKTYMAARLIKQLEKELPGRTIVISPPILLDENNPGSWTNVFHDFGISAKLESIGKIDKLVEEDLNKYKNVVIDEAHRFRNESNVTYETLSRICRGKRVILVSATPLNNTPADILNQIKLFQKPAKSNIPNVSNLNMFFATLKKKLKNLDRKDDYEVYMDTIKQNAKEIRENVLKHLMVRRTRKEILRYWGKDLEKQGVRFPHVAEPKPIFYELSKEEDAIFNKTLELIIKDFKYARYTPLLYYTGPRTQPEEISQINMGKFMKILLIKRLESSFFAFRQSINRFIDYYKSFIDAYDKGYVFVSKKYTDKVFDYFEEGDDETIQKMIEEGKANKYKASDFNKNFIISLKKDFEILLEIKKMWESVKRDPKLDKLKSILVSDTILKNNKIILFTESKETSLYLYDSLPKDISNKAMVFSSEASRVIGTRQKVIDNFDARAKKQKEDYKLLITTEVLAEGVNLHRSNTVINYDIPWNPTRLMQRVGRINRVDTKFEEIYAFNFFPTVQANNEIKLKEAAEAKIHAFIEMLGADARLLTEGEEIKSHELYTKLTSSKYLTGEDESEESELEYLQVIKDIRMNDPSLFERIKRLPKKARTSKRYQEEFNSLLTYFRKGKLHKFFISNNNMIKELDFISAAKILSSKKDELISKKGEDYYKLLESNKNEFKLVTLQQNSDFEAKGGRDKRTKLWRIINSKEIKNFKGYTEEEDEYLENVKRLLVGDAIPKMTLKEILKAISRNELNPLKVLASIKSNLPSEFFKEMVAEEAAQTSGPREVILSVYLKKDE